jgi:GntR family transcriptional regulator / MocR family aminotransferase
MRIDRASDRPMADQIYVAVCAQIECGRLSEGSRLPSSRGLSKALGVARSTVSAAFDRLLADGLVESHVGSGTYVARTSVRGEENHSRADSLRAIHAPLPGRATSAQGNVVPPFTLGPSLEYFPFEIWQSLAAEQVRSMRWFASNGDPAGYEPLRVALAEFTRQHRGIRCSPSQIIITMGATQALDMIVRTVGKAGDVALIEDPSDPRMRHTFANSRIGTLSMMVDEQGADIATVDASALPADGAKIILLTPVRQYPLGAPLSAAREQAITDRAARWRSWIVEMDATFTMRPARNPIMAAGEVNDNRVIYHTSLSWVMFRSLRMGYIVAPDDLVPALLATRQFMDVHPPMLEQAILAEFVARGHMSRYVAKMQAVNEDRQRSLINAWPGNVASGVRLLTTSGGLSNVVMLPDGVDDEAIVRAALTVRMAPIAISSWYASNDQRGLLLGFASRDGATTARAVEQLAVLIAGEVKRRPNRFDAASRLIA